MSNRSFAPPQSGGVPLVILTQSQFPRWLKAAGRSRYRNWVKNLAFEVKPGQHLVVYAYDGTPEIVIMIGSEPLSMWDLSGLVLQLPPSNYSLVGDFVPKVTSALALGWGLGAYAFDKYRTTHSESRRLRAPGDRARLIWPPTVDRAPTERAIAATSMVRDMINTPSADMGPAELAALCRAIARRHRAVVNVSVGRALLEKNYPMIHAVGRASARAPRLIDMRWGHKKRPRVTIVGKGVCFDSGGLNVKPFEEMLGMKLDMAGAAHALALAEMIMSVGLPVHLRVMIPAVENSISANAYRPLDVLRSRKGLTVEVGSTDAEGRLILADALTAADEESPELLIDFGTLTSFEAGAGLMGAFFTRDDQLAVTLQRLSSEHEDPLWRMPLTQLVAPRLRGKVADLTNTGSIYKGSTLRAAMFLSRFVDRASKWVHVDLSDGNDENRPGRPIGGEAFGLRSIFAMIEHLFPLKVESPTRRRH